MVMVNRRQFARLVLGAGMLLGVAACGRTSEPPATAAPLAAAPRPAPAPERAAPPPVVVVVRNGASPGSLEIEARAAVELDARLIVERQTKDGGWEPLANLDLDSLKLVEACTDKPGACVTLAAGRTLRPVPWSGMSCSSQCNGTCDKNVQREGRHRFVVQTCDGKARFEGPPFELPPSR
jgi:hypothetical protein